MSDLVERLRYDLHPYQPIKYEAADEIERLEADYAECREEVTTFSLLLDGQVRRNTKLQAVVDALECDSEWCGKSPHGTPGKRGYDDGKCQICKARAALKETDK